MARPFITVPPGILRPLEVDWQPDWRGQSSGTTTNGVTKIVVNAMPRWIGSPKVILRQGDVARWRAMRTAAQGLVGIYLIEMRDPIMPVPMAAPGGIPFSTGVRFSTAAGWAYAPSYLNVGIALPGATEVVVDVPEGMPAPTAGRRLSANLWPFEIVSVETVSAGRYRLGVAMFRTNLADGEGIDLRPLGLFEAIDGMMGNPSYGASHTSSPSLSFREWINRP